MYERFTDRARKIVQLANQEAQRLNHEWIGTEHILLGLIKEGSGVAASVLKNLHVDPRAIRLEVEKAVRSGPDMPPMGKLPQTPRAKKVIEHSVQQARNLNHNHVGSEHILLGLLCEQEGVAWLVLTNFGLDLATVRAEINRLLGPTPRQSTGERQSTDESLGNKRAPAAPRTCPKCGHSPVVRVAPEATLDERIRGDVAAGTLILVRSARSPLPVPWWVCLHCEPQWSEVQRLSMRDHELQIAKENAVAVADFVTAARLRDAQRELRRQVDQLVEGLLNGP